MKINARVLSVVLLLISWAALAADPTSDTQFITSHLKFKKGIAIDVGCGDAKLATSVAQAGELFFYCLESEQKDVDAARVNINAAGIYGQKACANLTSFDLLHYPDNCATLIICGDQLIHGLRGRNLKEIYRVLSPNGVALIGRSTGISAETPLTREFLESALKEAHIASFEIIEQNGIWARITKPNPAGSDEWTQRAHDASNTFASNDTLIAGQSFVPRWYTGNLPGLSSAGVAISNGRLIFAGASYSNAPLTTPFIQVLDAFTGIELWSKVGAKDWPIDRPMGTYSNRENSDDMIAVGDTLYLLANKFCQVVDLADGKIQKSLALPQQIQPADDDAWLYISHDAGALYCASGPSPNVRVDWNSMFYRGNAKSIFAMDVKSGSVLWNTHIAGWTASICIGDGKLYYCDTNLELHALNTKTGAEEWKTKCKYPPGTAIDSGAFFEGKYFLLRVESNAKPRKEDENKEASEDGKTAAAKDPANAPSTVLTNGHNHRKLDAYLAKEGKFLFACDLGNNSVADVTYSSGVIYAAGEHSNGLAATDAETGKLKWSKSISSKCTPTLATPHCILMRSPLVTRVFDLSTVKGSDPNLHSIAFDGFRPTCSYPAVPAYGMLFIQAEGCNCSAAIRGNVAMVPGKTGEPISGGALVKGATFDHKASSDEKSWATWRADAARSGKVDAKLPPALKLQWSSHFTGELTQLAVAHGQVFFGSSAQKLLAVDAKTGKTSWEYFAQGKISVAPCVSDGRVYFGDDAGFACCLSADSGQLAWRYRAAPAFDQIILHGRLASRWPCGSGVLVHDDTAYLTAGLFPEQGTTLYALDSHTGEVRWQKTLATSATSSSLNPVSFVARGPLALSSSKLYLTTGIGMPWSVSLDNAHKATEEEGASKSPVRKVCEVMPQGDSFFYSAPELPLVHHVQYKKTSSLRCLPIVDHETVYRVNYEIDKRPCLAALKTTEETFIARPQTVLWIAWKGEPMTALIAASDTLISGGVNKIYATSMAGKELWSLPVNGTVEDLAVYRESLFVLTSTGDLICFAR